MSDTYKSAGVDIDAGDETVKRIKNFAKSTFNENVLSEIGLFGGFYKLNPSEYKEPVLVSSVDGVGTKLKVAIDTGVHNTIGQDIVNHCVDDIAVCGAEPLFFLDYAAFGKLKPEVAEKIVEGISKACIENGCALIGGETAEMPGMYAPNDYDISGTVVGIVEKSEIINGSRIEKGNVLIGFPSNGLHTNGYSLARKVLLSKYDLASTPDELDCTVAEELLKVHKSYLKLIKMLKGKFDIKGFSHITGGGIAGNTKRIIPQGLKLSIDWKSWEISPIFKLIQDAGNIRTEEMRNVFNLGIGLIAVADKNDADSILKASAALNENGIIMGEIK